MTTAPELVELTITDIAYGGDGVGRLPDGLAVFVPFTAIGDQLQVRVTERHKNYLRGELVTLVSPGPGRTEPRCELFGRCGGCQYQHLTAETQLVVKTAQLQAALKRIGHLAELPPIAPVVGSRQAYGYRNKIVLHPLRRRGQPAYGYYARDNQTRLAVASCPLAAPELDQAIQALTPDDVQNVPLVLRLAGNRRVFRYYGRPEGHEPWLRSTVQGRRLEVPLGSFCQVNPEVADALAGYLRRRLGELRPSVLVDLYCGSGMFALVLGAQARRVIGIEADRDALRAAGHNATAHGLANTDFHAGRVEEVLPELIADLPADGALAVLDPPREGCAPEVITALLTWRPERLVYVSCNPASLARDLQRLAGQGAYRIEHLALYDMFPQTTHFESVAILERAAATP